jgi:hypothetical protein
MTSLPNDNDSAISIATTSPDTSKPLPVVPPIQIGPSSSPKSKPGSPHTPGSSALYASLTAEEQAAQDLENDAAVAQAQGQIDIDSGADAQSVSDAGYESDTLGTASTSLSSRVRDYTFENGRRYHRFREGMYNFPNDDSEQDREDMKHAMVVNLCQRLHFAPIGEETQNILDMGTGTGIWAIESLFSSSPVEG